MPNPDRERELFSEMISHHMKSFTEEAESTRDFHHEMYEVTKHVLWELQEEQRKNDKDT